MLRQNKENKLPDRTNNIWNRHDFAMCGLGEKTMLMTKVVWLIILAMRNGIESLTG